MAARWLSPLLRSLHDARLGAPRSDPDVLRQQTVTAVRLAAGAPAALFYAFGATPQGLQIARNWVLDGDGSRLTHLLRAVVAQPHRYASDLPDATRATDFETRSFVETRALWRRREAWEARTLTRELYTPLALGDQIRLLPFDGSRSVGWLGAFRYREQPLFGAPDRRRMAALVGLATEALAVAESVERAATPPEPAFAVVGPDGAVELASEVAAWWLARPGSARMLSRVLRESPPPGQVLAVSSYVGLTVVPLGGPGGPRRLVRIEPLAPLSRHEHARLSPTQRKVADLLVVAATREEIARHLGCGVETVRTHVRTIYERLGVSNRIELSRMLGESGSARSGASED